METMWKLFVIFLLKFSVAFAFQVETFKGLDVLEVLKTEPVLSVSETCKEHLKEYARGINASELWALYMFDSMPKLPDGIYLGHLSMPGHFDECVNAVNGAFSGKHCMAKLKIQFGQNSASKQGKAFGDSFTYGICFPSTCSAADIENAFKSIPIINEFIQLNVTEEACSTSGFRPFRTEDWVTVGVIATICLIAAASTAYDLFQRFKVKNENPHQLWASFSIYSNSKQLFRISKSTTQLKALHGIRFLSMCWVILAHAYVSYMMGNVINLADIPKFMNDKSFVPISNGFVSVDSFFFLSGLLVCLVFFRDISKKGTFDVPVAFIHRYMRLTPPFALLMLIQATIISRIGNGPFWNKSSDMVETGCREGWWTGLLYVQNYLKPNATCLGQAWYLSADMQMYWVSPLILYPLLWFPAYAPYFMLVLVLAAAFTNFAIAFVNKFAPNVFFQMSDLTNMSQFEIEYVPFHTRMAPWLIGVATGYIICGLQAKKIKLNLSKFWVIVGWIAACGLLGGSLFGILRFISQEYSTAESSFYLAFHRVGWGLGLSWVVIACVSGHGGIINDILSMDFFQPLAKLSYCNFLVHMTLQSYRVNTSRISLYVRHFDVIYGYGADLLLSNLISIPITLLFEIPFTSIDRHLFQKLVIFPLPRPKNSPKKENSDEKSKAVESSKDVEEGKINPAFVDSSEETKTS